ncbi:hypothetical protein Scep_013886 [Stephania cephalantha]|uniref:Uncharacterized protein n=1 Tax=Stephania cephalantha TaxID=152367 RepID=A0AAP0J1J0_9MAGN
MKREVRIEHATAATATAAKEEGGKEFNAQLNRGGTKVVIYEGTPNKTYTITWNREASEWTIHRLLEMVKMHESTKRTMCRGTVFVRSHDIRRLSSTAARSAARSAAGQQCSGAAVTRSIGAARMASVPAAAAVWRRKLRLADERISSGCGVLQQRDAGEGRRWRPASGGASDRATGGALSTVGCAISSKLAR